MITSASVFETPLVFLNPMLLIGSSGFNNYCWNPDGIDRGEPPINENEIYLAIKSNDLIPPDVFSDSPSKEQFCNITECSRREHVARIAWFVKNMDINESNCTDVDFYKNNSEQLYDVLVSPYGGCHRLCAMIYLKIERCLFRVSSGSRLLVESSNVFLGWYNSGPTHNNPFGKNVLSSDNGAWEIDSQISGENDRRIWINDINSSGKTIARFSLRGKLSSCEIYTAESDYAPPFAQLGVTQEEFIGFCSERISHDFSLLIECI